MDVPYKSEEDRCSLNLRWSKLDLATAKRLSKKIPALEAKIKYWNVRLKKEKTRLKRLAIRGTD